MHEVVTTYSRFPCDEKDCASNTENTAGRFESVILHARLAHSSRFQRLFGLLMAFSFSAYIATTPQSTEELRSVQKPAVCYVSHWSIFRSFPELVLGVMASLADFIPYGILSTDGIVGPNFSYSEGQKAICVTGIVDVPAIATNVEILYKGPENNYELTEFITNFVRRDTNTFATSIGGSQQISDTFSIYSKLCVPADTKNASRPTSVQFLSHGGTLDHTYWDFAPGYSYVDAAAEKGYATFSFDRLGTGKSTQPDPLQIVQIPLQVEIAHAIIENLKSGQIGGIAFGQVVGVGHSLGAALTQEVARLHPDDFDALVLTGHSNFHQGAGTGFAAAAQQISNTVSDRPELKGLPNGYYTLAPVEQALQFAFYYYPHFDQKSMSTFAGLNLFTNSRLVFAKNLETRHSNAVGETLTLGLTYVPTTFTKPVLLLNGQQDFFYCQGNCLASGSDVTADALGFFFPAKNNASQAITLSNIGHNINMHLGRLEVFEAMLEFVKGCSIKH
jgi:pimeloyl-ACP methyl ester carboxylesterase